MNEEKVRQIIKEEIKMGLSCFTTKDDLSDVVFRQRIESLRAKSDMFDFRSDISELKSDILSAQKEIVKKLDVLLIGKEEKKSHNDILKK
ncbi:MAG: hypothetical protein Q7S57_03235 [bacterium]|nr:hypothetical protein [bacterium]